MFAYRSLLVFSLASLWFGSRALAGAPSLNELVCRERGVTTQPRLTQKVFAEARAPTAQSSSARAVIYINPERTFLGRETQQWLYQRQCAHIALSHTVASIGDRGFNIRDEEAADCWAARELSKGSSSSRSQLLAIERDLERVIKDDKWQEVLPGPRRRVSFSSCPK